MAVISLLFRNRSASQTAFCTERIKNTSSIYLRQHKSAQLSAADTVESIAPPILSHILTAYNNCVPGKGKLEGGKAGFATLSAFPLVPAHAKMVPLKGKNAYASSILSGKEKAYASSILPGKEKAYASSILPGKEKVYASSILPGKEKSTPLVSPPERRCPPHPGALAGKHQASVSS